MGAQDFINVEKGSSMEDAFKRDGLTHAYPYYWNTREQHDAGDYSLNPVPDVHP